MLKTLAWKESRELMPLVSLALIAQGLMFVVPGNFLWLIPWNESRDVVPFVARSLVNWMLYLSGFAALALGFWQTLWETGRGTFLFLLHRPLSRTTVFSVKLAVGFAATLIITGLPILLHALWAATPGTHASPFYWSMTVWAWLIWFRMPVIYLGAFLSGLREGRWFGTRPLPLMAALLTMMIITVIDRWPLASLAVTLLVEACYLLVIYRVAEARDYS
jgi:hypothetical protein